MKTAKIRERFLRTKRHALMRSIYILRFIVLIGIAIHISAGSTVFSIQNGFMHLEMNQFSLVAYPFFVFGVFFSTSMPKKSSEIIAPWWRGFVAFLVDFITILSVIGIPLCLLALIIENNGYPQVWFIARELNSHDNLLYMVLVLPAVLLILSLVSLCLHSKLVSPGALLANVTVTTKAELPITKLAMYGFLSYFLVAFPFFKHFIILRKEKERLEPVVVLRNA